MANTEPHVDSAGGSGEVMDRWKTDNCESGGDRLSSRSTSLSRRLIGLAGVAALTVGGAGAVLLGAGAAYAGTSTLYSNNYTIGAPTSVSGVTFSASSTAAGAQGVTYTVGFQVPSNATVTSNAYSVSLSGLPTVTKNTTGNVILTDSTTGTSWGVVGTVSSTTAGAETFTIPSGDVNLGDTVSVQIQGFTNDTAADAATSNPYYPEVAVAPDLPGKAAAFNLVGAVGAVSVSSPTTDGPANYSLSGWNIGTVTNTGQIVITTTGEVTYPTSGAGFTVTDTPSGSTTAKSLTVSSAAAGTVVLTGGGTLYTETLTLASGSTVASSDVLGISFAGINPTTAGTYYTEVTNSAPATSATAPTTGSFTIGLSMGSLSLTVSPSTAGASNAVYGLSFVLPTGYSSADDTLNVSLKDNTGTSIPLGTTYAVFDSTNSAANTSGNVNAGTVSLGTVVAAGDSVTVDLYGVTNSTNASVSATAFLSNGGTAYTVNDTSNTVSYTAATTSSLNPSVVVSPNTAGVAGNYTISGFNVGTGGITASGTIAVAFDTGTGGSSTATSASGASLLSLPGNGSGAYTLTDLTSGSVISTTVAVSGNTVTFTLASGASANAGDHLQVTVTGAINPSDANTDYMVAVTGNVAAPTQATSTPTAATTYPNGAFVQSGGQIDVIAGGVGFGIPTFNDYQQIATSDSSSVVSGSFPTGTAVRTGTLLKVLGSPAIYVIGTNGDAYAFSTPTEFTSDGYSSMSVVNVPNLGSLTTGSGAAPTAAVTMPDGALVQSGSTIYVYAGGKAFGIPTFADYQTIAAATGTQVVVGTVSNTAATSLTAGTLIQPIGSAGIWVSDGTSIYQFSTASQFASDGYNGANVVPVPNATGLTQA